jgi:cobalt-zinc-cadmium efflux system outer membrane protein
MDVSSRRGCAVSASLSIACLSLTFCVPTIRAQSLEPDPSAVSLEAVLEHADLHAPALVVARARLEDGEAARSGAERFLSSPLTVEIGGGPRIAEGTGEDFDLLVALSQSIEIGGERGERMSAAEHLAARREAELLAVRWQVHREVHFAFHEAIEARVRLDAQTRWLAFAERMLEIARRRYESGDVGELELALAVAELASAQQQYVEADGHFRDARLSVAELSGWPASDAPWPAGELDPPHAVPDDAALVARALTSHPLLLALEAAVTEREARVSLADREAIPNVTVGLSFAREGSAGSPANYIGLLTLGVGIPVWDQNGPARAEARASLSIAEAERDALRSAIEARVLRAASSLRSSRDRVRIFSEQVLPGFESNLALLQQAFTLGELDALDVASATRRLLEVQGNALDAFAEYHAALAELEAQVGSEVMDDEAHGTGGERAPRTESE